MAAFLEFTLADRKNRTIHMAGRVFQHGQVIEIPSKKSKKTGATIIDIATHRQWVNAGICKLHETDPRPKPKKRKEEPLVEVCFVQSVALHGEAFTPGRNYMLPESRALKYIERKYCVPSSKKNEAMVMQGAEVR